ncbi:MAG: glycosyltransferase family 2 protein [Candidatus Fermentibacterota bacterium]
MLSVVIPSRNGARLLRRFLPPLLDDLGDLGEVVVVDDGSEDDTAAAVAGAGDGRVGLVRRSGPNGFCYAVNRGMEEAGGDLLLLLNNDVEPEPGALASLVDAAGTATPDVCALVPRILRPDGTDEGGCSVRLRRGLPLVDLEGRGVPYPSGACSLFTRRSWERLGGLDSRFAPIYWEDVDLGLRARRMGMRVARVPGAAVRHQHAATMGQSPDSLALRERNRLLLAAGSPLPDGWRLRFRLWLPVHVLMARLAGNRPFLEGYREYRRLAEEGI